jgi:cytochrome c peroxidase
MTAVKTLAHLAPIAFFAIAVASGGRTTSTYDWQLPKGFPEPAVPADNPMSTAKVELGRYLFYDMRLSSNGKSSCATCHRQELAFTDGKPVSAGTTGEFHLRNAMSLVNIAYNNVLTWSDPTKTKLEDQLLVPLYGTHPMELGRKPGDNLISSLKAAKIYQQLFASAFPDQQDRISVPNVAKAIACFERSIISANSPYDRYHFGDEDNAVSTEAKHGEELFFSEKYACFHCHGGFNFTDATVSKRTVGRVAEFHNNGLYNVSGPVSYPAPNTGIYTFTRKLTDVGKFKAPTLRNIAVTGPYMHDGSIPTLEGVIRHYAAGGRTVPTGPFAGDGSKNPNKDGRINGFPLTESDKSALLAFLTSLTDPEVLHSPRWSNPWPK